MMRLTRSSQPPAIVNPSLRGASMRTMFRRCKRWSVALSVLAAAVCLPGALLLALSEEAPIARKYAARAAMQAAREAGAAALAPEALSRAEEAFSAASRELVVQLQRVRWSRAFGRAEALLDVSKRRADLATELSRGQQTEMRERAHRLLSRAGTGFEQMEWLGSYIPPRSAIRSDVRRAQVSYSEARSLYDTGRFDRAVQAAQHANQG